MGADGQGGKAGGGEEPSGRDECSALLVHSTAGKCWSVNELATTAARVGFRGVDVRASRGDRSVMVFDKPGGET